MNQGTNTGNGVHEVKIIAAISLSVLFLHFYRYCPLIFQDVIEKGSKPDKIISQFARIPLFNSMLSAKLSALAMLFFYLLLSIDKSNGRRDWRTALLQIVLGSAVYFLSILGIDPDGNRESILIDWGYVVASLVGYFLILFGLTNIILYCVNQWKNADIFNKEGTSFPQEERKIETVYSLNLPAEYHYDGRTRKSWINLINPQRGILVLGSPGSGKSYFIIENLIRQFIEKGFAMFIYDYKYDSLTLLAYNHFLKFKGYYPVNTKFYTINFDDLSRSHRCNCIHSLTLHSIEDAIAVSRTLLLGTNKSWSKKEGDFWVESPMNFFAAIIWFLRKYEDGRFCTLPHAIELAHGSYQQLFAALSTEPEIELLINPFKQALENGNMDQLDGQLASAKIPLGRLVSTNMYYILSGDDFQLDINDPWAPKIFCLGGSAHKQDFLAPVLSLYIDRLCNMINRPGKYPSALICDEFATVRAVSVQKTIATGRSNDISCVIATQDLSQLKMHYSDQEAQVICNMPGNILCGQVQGDTAKMVSDRFQPTLQVYESRSQNSRDISLSESRHPGIAISAATLSNLSAGTFVGIVADDPQTPIEKKAFHARIINDAKQIEKERDAWVDLPVVHKVDARIIEENYHRIRREAKDILRKVIGDISNDPEAI